MNKNADTVLLLGALSLFIYSLSKNNAVRQIINTAAGDIMSTVNSISDYGKKLVEGFESLSLTKYWDFKGYSIGWGHFIKEGETIPESITPEFADQLLGQDLQIAQDTINKLVSVPLTQNQFDALTSFVYNEGVGHFSTSTLLKMLNAGDYTGASNQFDKWIIAGGDVNQTLVTRRQAEKDLFNTV